ncbi:MAG: hypothetical protein U1E97_08605 [Alphaproteobacteria bacterium]
MKKYLIAAAAMLLGAALSAPPADAANRKAQEMCEKGYSSLKGQSNPALRPGKGDAFKDELANAQKALAKSDYNTCNKHLSQARRHMQ